MKIVLVHSLILWSNLPSLVRAVFEALDFGCVDIEEQTKAERANESNVTRSRATPTPLLCSSWYKEGAIGGVTLSFLVYSNGKGPKVLWGRREFSTSC